MALDEEPSSEVPGTGSVTSFEWISPLEQEAPAESLPVSSNLPVGRAAPWTAAWDLALQLALTPGEFLAVDLSPLNPLIQSSRLLSAGEWTPAARLARALAAGEVHVALCLKATILKIQLHCCLKVCETPSICACTALHILVDSGLEVPRVYFANIKGPGVRDFTLRV